MGIKPVAFLTFSLPSPSSLQKHRIEAQDNVDRIVCNRHAILPKRVLKTCYVFPKLVTFFYRFIFSSDQQYRYLYFNHMNLAQKSSVHSRKSSLPCVAPEIMRLMGDISADFARYYQILAQALKRFLIASRKGKT